jgi:type IV pilus biogenesis protein CpaD/CtpE
MKTTLTLIATALLAACANTTPTTAGAKPYPLDTCIVTDNKLGSMGTPITKTYGDQQVKFCCKPCIAKFEKNPERYLAKIQ